jgi:hypothetical protein
MTAAMITEAQDVAQAAVTAALGHDRELASNIVTEHYDPTVLALVLVDLAAYIHHRWSKATGLDREQCWIELMHDVAEWREAHQ